MLLPGRIYILRGPWYFGVYRNIFLPNLGEDQKNSHHSSAGAPPPDPQNSPPIANFWVRAWPVPKYKISIFDT